MSKQVPVKRDNTKIYFFIIAITALLATNVYFYIKFKSSGEKLYTVSLQKEDLQIELDRIESELDNFSNVVHTASYEVFADQEQHARALIADLRVKLENNTLTEEEIASARKQIATLRSNVDVLRIDIAELKLKNELLATENDRLADEVAKKDEKNVQLSSENLNLKDKVTVASAIKVSNLQVNGVQVNKKGNIENESRVRRVDKIHIVFTIAENSLAKKGPKDIFVRVIDPQGNLIAHANDLFYVYGEKLQFTFKETIKFTNKGEEYQFLWETEKFAKGAYTFMLYADNSVMGRASLVLK